ncbi:MAG TPA: hypothetical protein VFC24_03360 [Casimicrobiaceae bacterium]|nr:hypothetical protein [Casimicrobiaceae bacterium]
MNSFKMKALALAVLGLAGFGVMGSAMACPTIDQTVGTVTPGGGGAWTSQFRASDATMNIVAGLNGSACGLGVSIGAQSSSRAFVEFDNGTSETHLRGRFYVSLNNLITGVTPFNQSNRTAVIHRINYATGPAQFTSDILVVRIAGGAGALGTGTAPSIRFFVSDANPASGATSASVPLPASASNTFIVEYDLQIGTAATSGQACNPMPASGGCFRYWVADAGTTISDTTPTGSITVNNAGWSGSSKVFLGLSTGSPNYRANHAGTVSTVDEFDLRRQTFIPN